jgi:hypothetical protein
LTLLPALINVPITLLLPLAPRKSAINSTERQIEGGGKMERNDGAKLVELNEQDKLLVKKPAEEADYNAKHANNANNNGPKIWPNLCNVFGQKIQVNI